ncbi:hypothetical protein FYJ79_09610 [Sharpea azabuensis]|uniref:Uncharacterized protein n=1 Tax=Sharpea porci TaxID=2652286 RepID=A0A844FW47_9FIRM|nr:hypothetical protein [Sharpea porci]
MYIRTQRALAVGVSDKLLLDNDVVVLCEYGQYDAQNEADFTALKKVNININSYDLFMSKIVQGTADGGIAPVTVITRKSLNNHIDDNFTYSTTFWYSSFKE